MKVVLAEEMGMCFGVRDALKILEAVPNPEQLTIHGELVHNEVVLQNLSRRGFHQAEENHRDAIPETPLVLVTAHGISKKERSRLESSGKELIDTTCPLVRRVHEKALLLQEEGYHILLIGKRGHVEVRGVIEDLNSFDVIERLEEVCTVPHPRLGIICQTTIAPDVVRQVSNAIRLHNPQAEIRFIDTTCHPTRLRQSSLEAILDQVEVMVVVGGKNSNNTKELVRLCELSGKTTHHVQKAEDLNPEWFSNVERVGLTAGTSTLDETINEVKERLESFPLSEEEIISRRGISHFRKNTDISRDYAFSLKGSASCEAG